MGILIDPRTGRPRGESKAARSAEIGMMVDASRKALRDWRDLTPAERCKRLGRLADAVEDDIAGYVTAEQAGTGKPYAEAAGEVAQSAELIRYYAWAARTGTGPAAGGLVSGHESWVRWEPVGVVGVVVPWNYPLLMAIWRCAPALAAGNTVLVKPAETTPDTVTLLARHAAETLGADLLQVVPGDRQTGRLLVDADVDMIAFTGSNAGGTDVAARAGIRRTSLELGGNGPVLVLPDAPDFTADRIAAACTYNAGQSCAAPARVICLAENYEAIVTALSAAMGERVAGRDFGPLNNTDQLVRYDTIVAASQARHGAPGPTQPPPEGEHGFWRPATVLAELTADDPAVTEEVFGPLLTVQHAPDLTEVLALANGVPQGLAGSVWTRDLATGLELAGALNVGEAWVNCHLVQTAELPHGGRGASGTGTDLSVLALHEYQRPKTVTVCLER